MSKGRKKGQKTNQGVVYETAAYKISVIPLNYQIECKLMKSGNARFEQVKLISEPFYSYFGWGLEYAKKTAEMMVNKYQNAL